MVAEHVPFEVPYMRNPAAAMRSPSPQLAGSKRNSYGDVLEVSAWERRMADNFGCEIATGECNQPICVNPQHLLVDKNAHDDLHRHSACLIPPSPTPDRPVPDRKRPPPMTISLDICAESSCLAAVPQPTEATDIRCQGMFWDPACSPLCYGDEACTAQVPCADPNCGMSDPCFDDFCPQVGCFQQACPDDICITDEVCYSEPCPRASSREQGHCAPAHWDNHFYQDACHHCFGQPCHLPQQSHGNTTADFCGSYHGLPRSDDESSSHTTAPTSDQMYSNCLVPSTHRFNHCHRLGHDCSFTTPQYYAQSNTATRNGQPTLGGLGRLTPDMYSTNQLCGCTLPQTTMGSYKHASVDHGSVSASTVSSPDPSLVRRPHHRQNCSGALETCTLHDSLLKGVNSHMEHPIKRLCEGFRCSRETELGEFGSDGQFAPEITSGVAPSVENTEHICLWTAHTKGEGQQPVLCNKRFSSAKELAEHMKEDHTEGADGKYCCQWHGCPSKTDFKQSGKLARHFAIHSKYKRFQCEHCAKSFNTAQTLENHHNTHTGNRPHVCHYEGCNYAAATATQLKGHIQGTHLKEKRFQCKLCDFCCTDSSNLTKHENGVHGRKEYRCPHPGCSFPVIGEWAVVRKHFKETGHCPELLESNSKAQKMYKKSAVVKDQAAVMANGRRAPISRNRTKRSDTIEQKFKSESAEPA